MVPLMLHLHNPEALETVLTGRNVDLSAVLSETRAILKYFYKTNNNKKDYYIELNLVFWLVGVGWVRVLG